ncbi:MAG: hypothetical protein KIT74_10305 [Fimbriimonadales bacterium]|nr:hypothetical protein [Fimbriimonadales bacterium]
MRRQFATPLCGLVVFGFAANGNSQYIDLERVSYEVPKGCNVEKGYEWIVKLPGEAGEVTIKDQNSQLDETGIMGRALKEYQAHLRSIEFPSILGPYRWLTAQDYEAIVWWVKSQPESQDVDKVSSSADWRAIIAAPKNSYIELQARLSGDIDNLIPLLEELINSITYDRSPYGALTKVDLDAVSEKLPYPLWPPKSDPDELAVALAGTILTSDDPTQAILLALKRSGFYVKNSKGEKVVEPERGKGIGLFVEALEVLLLSQMHATGVTSSLSDTVDAFESLGKSATKLEIPFLSTVQAALRKDYNGTEPHSRFMARLIVELGKQMPIPYDLLSEFVPDGAQLAPIQFFMIARHFSESLRVAASRAKDKLEPELVIFPESASSQDAGKTFSDWLVTYQEDAVVYGTTTLVSIQQAVIQHLLEAQGAFGAAGKVATIGTITGLANMILAVSKFFCMYASVRAHIKFEKPRIRRTTETTSDGDSMKAWAWFWLDPEWRARLLKSLRALPMGMGLDIDMPKAGPLAGVETEWGWDEGGRKAAEYVPEVFVGYDGRADRVVTDATGKAQVQVMGLRQKQRISDYYLVPVHKYAVVTVKPQMKSNDITQAILDLSENTAGVFLTGPLAFLVPVFETVYRMKTGYTARKKLEVVDWDKAAIRMDLQVSITGSGRIRREKYAAEWKVLRQATVENVILAFPDFPLTEAALNNALSPSALTYQVFKQPKLHRTSISIQDSLHEEGEQIDCDTEKPEKYTRTTTWTAPVQVPKRDPSAYLEGVMLEIDWLARTYELDLPGIGSALLMTEVDKLERTTRQSGTGIQIKKQLFVQNDFDVELEIGANQPRNIHWKTGKFDLPWSRDDLENRDKVTGSKTLSGNYKGLGPVEIMYRWDIYYADRSSGKTVDVERFFDLATLTAPRTYDESFDQTEYEQAPTCWMPTVRPKPLPTVLEALIQAIFKPYVSFGSQ